MNDIGFESLRNAIVVRAVDDYCDAVRMLSILLDKNEAYRRILLDCKHGRIPKLHTVEEVEAEILVRIKMQEDKLEEVERFFNTEWYKNLCPIGSKYMIKKTKEKSIDDMVNLCINNLSKVKEKNLHSKRTQKSLRQFEILKNFLLSDWLKKLTKRDAESILQYMKSESNCMFCDFSV